MQACKWRLKINCTAIQNCTCTRPLAQPAALFSTLRFVAETKWETFKFQPCNNTDTAAWTMIVYVKCICVSVCTCVCVCVCVNITISVAVFLFQKRTETNTYLAQPAIYIKTSVGTRDGSGFDLRFEISLNQFRDWVNDLTFN